MKYTKMHGAGNDFIIINNISEQIPAESFAYLARTLCSRRTSIGADGIMFVERSEIDGDYKMIFFNSDGTEGEMCGNGARCICRYGYEKGLATENQSVETKAGLVKGRRINNRNYRIKLNNPTVFTERKDLEVDGITYSCSYIELGDPGLPHIILEYPDYISISEEELYKIGRGLRSHGSLKIGANVNFYHRDEEGVVHARTFERGVEDFTLACGTGAGSIGYVIYRKGGMDGGNISIKMPGGLLEVQVTVSEEKLPYEDIYLTGPTNIVSEGTVLDEDLILQIG